MDSQVWVARGSFWTETPQMGMPASSYSSMKRAVYRAHASR